MQINIFKLPFNLLRLPLAALGLTNALFEHTGSEIAAAIDRYTLIMEPHPY